MPYNPNPTVPETYRNERPSTYPDNPQPHTHGDNQLNMRPIPSTSGDPGNTSSGPQPQLIDPDSHTTQAPQRTWSFQRAVASQDDLTSRIIPVEHHQPAPRVQAEVPMNSGWRTTR